MIFMDLPDNLRNLKRRDLQRLCKAYNIKANMKNSDMIQSLLEVMNTTTKSSVSLEKSQEDLEQQNREVPSQVSPETTTNDIAREPVQDTDKTIQPNIISSDQSNSEAKQEAEPNSSSPRSCTESIHDSEQLMDVSIKANVGSPLSTREHCLDDYELDVTTDQVLEKSDTEALPPVNIEGSEDVESAESDMIHMNNLEQLATPEPAVDNVKQSTMGPDNVNSVVGDNEQLMTKCNDDNAVLPDSCGDESDKLNTTYTIESPEQHISPATDPFAALNESLTVTPKQFESTPLHGSWLIKDATAIKDSPLTRNQTSVKADTESTAADKMVATDKEQTTYKEGKENIASKHDQIMSLLNSRVDNIINDPNYVSEVKSLNVPSNSRIPVMKGSIAIKFDKLHAKEFNKMKSIDQVYQSRKRPLDSTTDGPTLSRSSKKPKIQTGTAEVKPAKPVTKSSCFSKSTIDRLSTPKNKVFKKSFTNQPGSGFRASFK